MNGIYQMQGGKNWILPQEMNANRFFWDSNWLEIWPNHLFHCMGLNGGSVAMSAFCEHDEQSFTVARWKDLLMLSSGANVITREEMLSSGATVIIWD
jgi:hypothetical protein